MYTSMGRRAAHRVIVPVLTLTLLSMAGCGMPHVQSVKDEQPEQDSEPPQVPGVTPVTPVTPQPGPEGPRELAPPEVSDVGGGEGDGALQFTVTHNSTAVGAVTIHFETEDGSAVAGSDYERVSDVLTFPTTDQVSVRTIEVAVRDDTVAEGTETFLLVLRDAQGETLATATATIADDDARAVLVRPRALNVLEGGSGTYSVALTSRPTASVTVTAAAPAGTDLSVVPAELAFTPHDWAMVQTVTVTAQQDDDALADAAVELAHTVRGGDYSGTPVPAIAVTVVEDDAPTLAVAAAHAAESARVLRFAVSLSLVTDTAVTVEYATGTAHDTASAGSDYTAADGRLVFEAQTTAARTIAVTVHDDTLDEPDEDFTVTLRNPVNALLAGGGDTATVTGTIENDDVPPVLSVADAGASEDASGIPLAVTLDTASGRTVTVNYATANVTAAAGADYTAASGTLTFPAGTTARTITVPITDDALDEADEVFRVTLSAPVHATVDANGKAASATITDDDTTPWVRVADATVSEGTEEQTIRFAVTLDPASGRKVTVQYATADGTATSGTDYTAARGTLTFPAGTTVRTIAVPVTDDALDEADDEQFMVTLSAAVHATVAAGGTATGTIRDDDQRGVRVEPTALTIHEGGNGGRYTILLTSQPAAAVTVDVTVPANAGLSVMPGHLTFPPADWMTAKTVTVTVGEGDSPVADGQVELGHTVTGGGYGGESAAPVTVTVVAVARPELAIAAAHAAEDDGELEFAVTLSPAADTTVTVGYTTGAADDTATAGADYTSAIGTLTFPTGATARTISVAIVADRIDEDTETFTVTLSNPQNAVLTTAAATGTIDDSNTRGVHVEPTSLALYEGAKTASYTVALTSQPAANVTVQTTTAPDSTDVTVTSEPLSFTTSDWATARTVMVTAGGSAMVGDAVTIGHTATGGDYAAVAAPSVTVTITEPPPLELGSLQVTGGGAMYPAFDGGVNHYAVSCEDPSTTLDVTAQALRAGARVTSLRASEDDNQVSFGSLEVQVAVNSQHDIAIADFLTSAGIR